MYLFGVQAYFRKKDGAEPSLGLFVLDIILNAFLFF